MPKYTPKLGLYYVEGSDPADGDLTVNLDLILRDNWVKIDALFHESTGHKHDGTAGNGPKLTSAAFEAGAVTDTAIGNRTIDDTVTAAAGADTPTRLWSKLAYMIKAITGKANWYTAPATTLEAAANHANATTGVHGATSAATANRLAIRDANGNMSVGNASADGHALNRVTADGRYVGRRVLTLTAGTYNDLDVSNYDVVDCQTDGGDIIINNVIFPAGYGNRVRFVKTRAANNLIFKYNPDKGMYTNCQKDLTLSAVDRYGMIEAQIFSNVCYASIMTWNADQLGGIPAERFIYGDNHRGTLNYAGDLNNILKSGFYFATTGHTNSPTGGNGFFTHINGPGNDLHAFQLFMENYTQRLSFRRKSGGTWNNWADVWHNENLPYETGTFTPELNFGGASTGITYTTRTGRYTRIGNVVYWAVHIALTSKGTATGAATIAGLPFTSINSAPNATSAVGLAENITLPEGADWACGVIFNNSTEITLRASGNISNINLTNTNFANNSGLRMEGFYYI
jgi:hypothetical protein